MMNLRPRLAALLRRPRKSVAFCLALACAATSLSAQGIAAVAVPRSDENSEAAYHAKVREAVTMVLQNLTESLQRKDSLATVSTYTRNARSFVGDRPEAVSAAAVVKQLFATPLAGSHLALTVDDFDMSGELAFVSGVLVAQSDSADTAPSYIRSLFVLRFDDWRNRWQVREQILNWREATEPATPAQ
jgi:ketosteroid isomerase-like protein